MMFVINKTIW